MCDGWDRTGLDISENLTTRELPGGDIKVQDKMFININVKVIECYIWFSEKKYDGNGQILVISKSYVDLWHSQAETRRCIWCVKVQSWFRMNKQELKKARSKAQDWSDSQILLFIRSLFWECCNTQQDRDQFDTRIIWHLEQLDTRYIDTRTIWRRTIWHQTAKMDDWNQYNLISHPILIPSDSWGLRSWSNIAIQYHFFCWTLLLLGLAGCISYSCPLYFCFLFLDKFYKYSTFMISKLSRSQLMYFRKVSFQQRRAGSK